ncbi:MAG: hypothetical protein WC346_20685 [Methanogenium sp.]|jgi:hypothetical protein
MATGNISPEDLNNVANSSEALGGGLKGAAIGAFTLTEEAAGLTAVLSDLGSTLDYVTRNPLLSFTFFERIGRSLQKDIIENLRTSKNLTEDQVKSWNRWGTAINFTSSAILSFATKIAHLQTQLRHASIESSRFFNTTAVPYGGSAFNSMLQINKNQALQTLLLSSEFGKSQTEVTQNLGRMITSQMFRSQLGMNTLQSEAAHRNYMERITLYARAFPDANIPELSKRIYGQFGGHGMSTFGAVGAATSFARRAGEGGFVPTAGVGENVNALLSLMEDYKRKGMAPETAFQAAQSTLIGLGSVKGKAGETLPLQTIMKLSSLYQGRSGEQEILANALGVNVGDRQKLLGTEGPQYFISSLQKWAKGKGLGDKPGSAVQDIVTKSLGSKFGASFEDLIMLANLPDISSKTEDIKGLVETFSKLNAGELSAAKKGIDGLTDSVDSFATGLRKQEKRAQNLPDMLSGGIDYVTTGVTQLASEYGVDPWMIQSLVAGGVGLMGVRKLLNLGKKIKGGLPALMGGKAAGVGELSSTVLGEFAGPTTQTAAKLAPTVAKTALRIASRAAGIIGTGLLVYDMIESVRESSEEAQYRSGKKTRPVPLPKAFKDLQNLKRIGVIKTDEEALQFLEKEGVSNIRNERANLNLGGEVSLKNLPSYNMADTISSTLTYPNTLKEKDVSKKAKEEGEEKGVLHVLFGTDSGTDLGEVMVKTGETAFINMHLGTILNSFGSK